MLNPNFAILGAAVQFFGGWGYFIDTLKGKVKPNKVSWLLWSIAPLIAAFAQIKQGVGILFITTFVVGFLPVIIFIASFVNKDAKWKITKFDLTCGLLSLIGLVLWLITKVGNVAIFFSIVADGLASVPTILKSYSDPESENDSVYWFGTVNAALGLLTISTWKFEFWGFPLYLLFCSLGIAILIRFKIGKRFSR